MMLVSASPNAVFLRSLFELQFIVEVLALCLSADRVVYLHSHLFYFTHYDLQFIRGA
jgi:hypothetical protein